MNTRWWSYIPDDGYTTWDSEALARADCERTIAYYRDQSQTDGWDDNVTAIACGPYVAAAEVVEVAHQNEHHSECAPYRCSEDCRIPPGFDSWADYGLVSVTNTTPDDVAAIVACCGSCRRMGGQVRKSYMRQPPPSNVATGGRHDRRRHRQDRSRREGCDAGAVADGSRTTPRRLARRRTGACARCGRGDVVNIELMDCTNVLLREIASPEIGEKGITQTYAMAICSSFPTDWPKVNEAIAARFKAKGRERIKKAAWKLIEGKS
jgi:hypothetical protein